MVSARDLKALLLASGAALVGIGSLGALAGDGFRSCAAFAVPLPPATILGIPDGPNPDYYHQYHALNQKLDSLALLAGEFLERQGCRAFPQTTSAVAESPDCRTPFPHKTCATRAGLGWIGKSALLVTPEFGPAVRLGSVLTDAAFDQFDQPVSASRCGGCTRCADHCPGKAILGNLWDVSTPREALVNVFACRRAARALARERLGKEITLCGRCIAACPYTQKYLKSVRSV